MRVVIHLADCTALAPSAMHLRRPSAATIHNLSSSMSSLTSLPEDTLLDIMRFLKVKDILALRQTCTDVFRATRHKQLWSDALRNEVPRRLVISYTKSLDKLSSIHAETLALQALRLQEGLQVGKQPVSTVTLHRPRSVTWVRLIRGTWLLSAESDRSSSVLSLWSIRAAMHRHDPSTVPKPQAEVFLDGPVAGGEVDVQNDEVIIALDIRSPDPSVRIVGIHDTGSGPFFVDLACLSGSSRLRCLRGAFVGYAVQDEISIPCVTNWKTRTLIRVKSTPDREGGCLAMLICDPFVIIVSTKKVEAYTFNLEAGRTSMRLAGSSPISVLFVDTALTLLEEENRSDPDRKPYLHLRLCTTGRYGLHLYDIEVSGDTGETTIRQIHHFLSGGLQEISSPSFGSTSRHLSWFRGRTVHWKPVAIESGWVSDSAGQPQTESSAQRLEPSIALTGMDIPALYCRGVRDFDETRGILALGNSFGEFVLYDFSGSDPQRLEECFRPIRFASKPTGVPMPMEPINFHAVLPFPYCGPLIPNDLESIFAAWARFQPNPPPEGWSTDFSPVKDRDHPNWRHYVPALGCYGRSYEYDSHMLGTPIPIMWKDPCLVVFLVGGILLLFTAEDELLALNPEVTLDDIANAAAQGRERNLPGLLVPRQSLAMSEDQRLEAMWMWEWAEFGRNRWQEMKDRGGDVDPCWTDVPRPARGWWSLTTRGRKAIYTRALACGEDPLRSA